MIRALLAVAIVGATVHTGEGPPIQDATVLIEGNRIAAVGTGVALPSGTRIVEARGQVVTPGLVESYARLGLDEVRLEPSAVEGTAGSSYDPVRATLRVWDTFNPLSPLLAQAHRGGITSAVIVPRGGVVAGQSAWVDLTPEGPVREAPVAVHVDLTGLGLEEGARTRAFLQLREVLEDARLFRANRGPYISRKLRELSVSGSDLEVLARALDAELLVVLEVDRAPGIRTTLEIIRDHRLRACLLGVNEGWLVAEEIARAGVPVLVNPLEDLPRSFSSLHARPDNAARLRRAGVEVAFTGRGTARTVERLRHLAGNAVARGVSYDDAIAAITRVPAEIFGIVDAGTLRPGALANLVVWNGDPLELTTWAVQVYVRGEPVSLRSRQELLTERYRSR